MGRKSWRGAARMAAQTEISEGPRGQGLEEPSWETGGGARTVGIRDRVQVATGWQRGHLGPRCSQGPGGACGGAQGKPQASAFTSISSQAAAD